MNVRRVVPSVLLAAVAVLVTIATAGRPLQYAWWMVAPGIAVGAVATGVRHHRPAHRLPWYALLASLTLLWF